MLKIRLQRIGRRKSPAFRIVVVEHTTSPKSGTYVEKLGTYNPKTKERTLNEERVKHWLSVGAKASGTMHNMLISLGVVQGKKINVLPRKSPPKIENKEDAKQSGEVSVSDASEAKPAEDASASGGKEKISSLPS